MATNDEIRDEIRAEAQHTRDCLREIKACLVGDLGGRKGLMDRVENLERSESVRNRTVCAAVAAVLAAIANTIFQLFATGQKP